MEESEEIKKAYAKSMDAWVNNDADTWFNCISKEKGVILTGTDPEEWFREYDNIVEKFKPGFANKRNYTWSGDIEAFKEGSVGWLIGKVVIDYPDGAKLPFRHSCVVHEEDGEWKLVQSNIALEVPNEKTKMVLEKSK